MERLTITIDYPSGQEPYVFSLLQQVQTMVVDFLHSPTRPGPKELTALGITVRLALVEPPSRAPSTEAAQTPENTTNG